MPMIALPILSLLLAVQGTAPSSDGTASRAQSAPASKPAATLASTMARLDDEWMAVEAAFKEKRLLAIEQYLLAAKDAADRADALLAAATLAHELSRWTQARGHAEGYLRDFPQEEKALEMQACVARCLSREPGKADAARAAWQKVIDGAGDNVNAGITGALELVELHLDQGDRDSGVKVLKGIQEKFGQMPGLSEFVQGRLAELDEVGKEPKPIDVIGLDGKPIRLADLKGKVVLIDFWATWCAPCVQDLPNVMAVYKKLHDRGFEVIGISLDEEEGRLREFLKQREITWPQYWNPPPPDRRGIPKDSRADLAKAYNVQAIPKTLLLDREGKVRRVGVSGEALMAAVERLLGPAK